jgi:hypothetical protein
MTIAVCLLLAAVVVAPLAWRAWVEVQKRRIVASMDAQARRAFGPQSCAERFYTDMRERELHGGGETPTNHLQGT